jgi:hypothetical protein
MRRPWVAHLSRGAKGGAFEVDGFDEHLPPFSTVPVRSSIPGCPRPVRAVPTRSGASRGSGRNPIGALPVADYDPVGATDTLFTLSLEGLSRNIQTTYK